jgi:hypothetical protein
MNKIPTNAVYDGSERLSEYHERRHWPIQAPTELYEHASAASLSPGQLVQWVMHPNADMEAGWNVPLYTNKCVGLVIKTRWVLADWMRHDKKEPKLYPEALILWADGETTNTSHGALCAIE